jgi:hypothetical protein
MGRKSRKKVIKRNEQILELEEEEENDTSMSYENQLENDCEQYEKMLKIRTNILQFREDNNLPLCEYLTPDLMNEFVSYVMKHVK